MKNKNQFGTIDTSNGMFQEGHMENDEMKFKKTPWYKRLLAKEPSEKEFLGVRILYSSNYDKEYKFAVYREYNPYTNKTLKIYSENSFFGTEYYNIDAFERMGQFIKK